MKTVAAMIATVFLFTTVSSPFVEASLWEDRRNATRRRSGGESGVNVPAEEKELTGQQSLLLARFPAATAVDFGALEQDPRVSLGGIDSRSSADLGAVPSPDQPTWLSTLVLPHGAIREVYLSEKRDAPFVLHIQDAHDVEEAQRNIASMIRLFQESRGVKLVGLEGASGEFLLEPFRAYARPDVRLGVADYLLRSDYIGGPEYAALTLPRAPVLWGVEDTALYEGNIRAYQDSVGNIDAIRVFIRDMEADIARWKGIVYSPKLKEFDGHFLAHAEGREGLGEYARYLVAAYDGEGPRPVRAGDAYPNVRLLVEAVGQERSLDFRKVEEEQVRLVKEMCSVLSESRLNDLVQKSLLYRMGRMSYEGYYGSLAELCRSAGIDLGNYGFLQKYVRYVRTAEKIKRDALLEELNLLERTVPESFCQRPDQECLLGIQRDGVMLGKLVRHAMSPGEWNTYSRRRSLVLALPARLEELGRGLKSDVRAAAPENFESLLVPFEKFCSLAFERNDPLMANLLAKMKKEGVSSSVLVAGGFHSSGLAESFRRQGISYAVVTPKITQSPVGVNSLDVFARDPLPLEKLFSGETVNLAARRTFAAGNDDLRARVAQGLMASLAVPVQMMLADLAEGQGAADEGVILAEMQKAADRLALEMGRLESLRFEPGKSRRKIYKVFQSFLKWAGKQESSFRILVYAADGPVPESIIRRDGVDRGLLRSEGKLDVAGHAIGFRLYEDRSLWGMWGLRTRRLFQRGPGAFRNGAVRVKSIGRKAQSHITSQVPKVRYAASGLKRVLRFAIAFMILFLVKTPVGVVRKSWQYIGEMTGTRTESPSYLEQQKRFHAINEALGGLEPDVRKELSAKVDLNKIASRDDYTRKFNAVVQQLARGFTDDANLRRFVDHLVPQTDFFTEFIHDEKQGDAPKLSNLIERGARYYTFDGSGSLVIPGGIEFWTPYLGEDLTPLNFLGRVVSHPGANRFLKLMAQYGLTSRQIDMLRPVAGRLIVDLGKDKVFEEKAVQVMSLIVLWEGDGSVLSAALPDIYPYVRDEISETREIFDGLRLQSPQSVVAVYQYVDAASSHLSGDLYAEVDVSVQSILCLLREFGRNRLLPADRTDSLLLGLMENQSQPDVQREVSNARWLREELAPVLARELDAWYEKSVQEGLPVDGIRPPEGADNWKSADWRDILIRSMVGITFQDGLYVPSQAGVAKVQRFLDDQSVDREDDGDFLLALVFANSIRYFSEDLYRVIPPDLVADHRAVDLWSGAWFSTDDGRILGSLFGLPSESGHLRYWAALKADSLVWEDEYRTVDGRLVKVNNDELYDRLMYGIMAKALPLLTFPEGQTYAYQTYRLGLEVLNDPVTRSEALDKLKALVDPDRLQILRQLADVSPSRVAPRLADKEVYYLGLLYREDPGYSSPLKSMLLEIRQRLVGMGVSEDSFQREVDHVVGVIAYASMERVGLFEMTPEGFWQYNPAMGEYEAAERLSMDVAVWLVRVAEENNIPQGITPLLAGKLFEYLAPLRVQKSMTDGLAIRNELNRIDPATVLRWIEELKAAGMVKTGVPRESSSRVSVDDSYRFHLLISAIGLLPFWPSAVVRKHPKLLALAENLIFQGVLVGGISLLVHAVWGWDLGPMLVGLSLFSSGLFTALHYAVYYDIHAPPVPLGWNPVRHLRPRGMLFGVSLALNAVVAAGIFVAPVFGGILGLLTSVSLHLLYNHRIAPSLGLPLAILPPREDRAEVSPERIVDFVQNRYPLGYGGEVVVYRLPERPDLVVRVPWDLVKVLQRAPSVRADPAGFKAFADEHFGRQWGSPVVFEKDHGLDGFPVVAQEVARWGAVQFTTFQPGETVRSRQEKDGAGFNRVLAEKIPQSAFDELAQTLHGLSLAGYEWDPHPKNILYDENVRRFRMVDVQRPKKHRSFDADEERLVSTMFSLMVPPGRKSSSTRSLETLMEKVMLSAVRAGYDADSVYARMKDHFDRFIREGRSAEDRITASFGVGAVRDGQPRPTEPSEGVIGALHAGTVRDLVGLLARALLMGHVPCGRVAQALGVALNGRKTKLYLEALASGTAVGLMKEVEHVGLKDVFRVLLDLYFRFKEESRVVGGGVFAEQIRRISSTEVPENVIRRMGEMVDAQFSVAEHSGGKYESGHLQDYYVFENPAGDQTYFAQQVNRYDDDRFERVVYVVYSNRGAVAGDALIRFDIGSDSEDYRNPRLENIRYDEGVDGTEWGVRDLQRLNAFSQKMYGMPLHGDSGRFPQPTAARKQLEAEGQVETAELGAHHREFVFTLPLFKATALVDRLTETERDGLVDLERSINSTEYREHRRDTGIAGGIVVKTFEGAELFESPDVFTLASLFFNRETGGWEFHVNRILLRALYPESGRRGEMIGLLMEREFMIRKFIARHLENGQSPEEAFDEAHREILTIPGQRNLFDWGLTLVVFDQVDETLQDNPAGRISRLWRHLKLTRQATFFSKIAFNGVKKFQEVARQKGLPFAVYFALALLMSHVVVPFMSLAIFGWKVAAVAWAVPWEAVMLPFYPFFHALIIRLLKWVVPKRTHQRYLSRYLHEPAPTFSMKAVWKSVREQKILSSFLQSSRRLLRLHRDERTGIHNGEGTPEEPSGATLRWMMPLGLRLARILGIRFRTVEPPARPVPGERVSTEGVPPRIGPYQIVGKIATSGSAEIYKAFLPETPTHYVAIKTLKSSGDYDEFFNEYEAQQAFRLESRLFERIGQLSPDETKYFPRIHEQGMTNGRPYIIMEYLEGPTLKDFLAPDSGWQSEFRGLQLDEKLEFVAGLLEALRVFHRLGYVHNDVNPANLFLKRGPDGRYRFDKLIDLGVATELSMEGKESPDILPGTHGFMSPEVLARRWPGPASDQFAAGTILSRLLTEEEKSMPIIAGLLQKATSRSPQDRFASLAEMTESLGQIQASLMRREPAAGTEEARAVFQRRLKTILWACGGVVGVFFLLWPWGVLGDMANYYVSLRETALIHLPHQIDVPLVDLMTGGLFVAIGDLIGQYLNSKKSLKEFIAAVVIGVSSGFAISSVYQVVDFLVPRTGTFVNQLTRIVMVDGLKAVFEPLYFVTKAFLKKKEKASGAQPIAMTKKKQLIKWFTTDLIMSPGFLLHWAIVNHFPPMARVISSQVYDLARKIILGWAANRTPVIGEGWRAKLAAMRKTAGIRIRGRLDRVLPVILPVSGARMRKIMGSDEYIVRYRDFKTRFRWQMDEIEGVIAGFEVPGQAEKWIKAVSYEKADRDALSVNMTNLYVLMYVWRNEPDRRLRNLAVQKYFDLRRELNMDFTNARDESTASAMDEAVDYLFSDQYDPLFFIPLYRKLSQSNVLRGSELQRAVQSPLDKVQNIKRILVIASRESVQSLGGRDLGRADEGARAGEGVGMGNYVSLSAMMELSDKFPDAEIVFIVDSFEGQPREGAGHHLMRSALFEGNDRIKVVPAQEALQRTRKGGWRVAVDGFSEWDLVVNFYASKLLARSLMDKQRKNRGYYISVRLKPLIWNVGNPLETMGALHDFSGSPERVIGPERDAGASHPLFNGRVDPTLGMPVRTMDVVRGLGLEVRSEQPRQRVDPQSADSREAAGVLERLGVEPDKIRRPRPVVLLDPYVGSRKDIKAWSEDEWVSYIKTLIVRLKDQGLDADFVMTQYDDGTKEAFRAENIATVLHPDGVSILVAPKLPLGIYRALMDRMDFVVTQETGSGHLAAALDSQHVMVDNMPAEWGIFVPPSDNTTLALAPRRRQFVGRGNMIYNSYGATIRYENFWSAVRTALGHVLPLRWVNRLTPSIKVTPETAADVTFLKILFNTSPERYFDALLKDKARLADYLELNDRWMDLYGDLLRTAYRRESRLAIWREMTRVMQMMRALVKEDHGSYFFFDERLIRTNLEDLVVVREMVDRTNFKKIVFDQNRIARTLRFHGPDQGDIENVQGKTEAAGVTSMEAQPLGGSLKEYGAKVAWWFEEAFIAVLVGAAFIIPGLAMHFTLFYAAVRLLFVALHLPQFRGPPTVKNIHDRIGSAVLVSLLPLIAFGLASFAGVSVHLSIAINIFIGFVTHGVVNLGVYKGWRWLPALPASIASREETFLDRDGKAWEELILQSVSSQEPLGHGQEAFVYPVVGMPDYIVRIPLRTHDEIRRWGSPLAKPVLKMTVDRKLKDLTNVGREMARCGEIQIMTRQPGVQIEQIKYSPDYLRALSDVPQSAFDEYAETLRRINAAGYVWEPYSGNGMFEQEKQRFHIIDIRKIGLGPESDEDQEDYQALGDLIFNLMLDTSGQPADVVRAVAEKIVRAGLRAELPIDDEVMDAYFASLRIPGQWREMRARLMAEQKEESARRGATLRGVMPLGMKIAGKMGIRLTSPSHVREYGAKVAWWMETVFFGLLPALTVFIPGLTAYFIGIQVLVRLTFFFLHIPGMRGPPTIKNLYDHLGAALAASFLPLLAFLLLPHQLTIAAGLYVLSDFIVHGLVNLGVYRGLTGFPLFPGAVRKPSGPTSYKFIDDRAVRARFGRLDNSKHFDLVEDEEGRVFFVKQRLAENLLGHKEKNDVRRELLAYEIGKKLANVAEVRTLSPEEAKPLKGVGNTRKGFYLTRMAQTYGEEELVHKNPKKARSAQLVFDVLVGRWDPHMFNRALVGETPVYFDFDAGFDVSLSFVEFMRWYDVEVGKASWLGKRVSEQEYAGYDVKEIRRSIIKFKALKPQFPKFIEKAGYSGAEAKSILNYLNERADRLDDYVAWTFEHLTGVDFDRHPTLTKDLVMQLTGEGHRLKDNFRALSQNPKALETVVGLGRSGYITDTDLTQILFLSENNEDAARFFTVLREMFEAGSIDEQSLEAFEILLWDIKGEKVRVLEQIRDLFIAGRLVPGDLDTLMKIVERPKSGPRHETVKTLLDALRQPVGADGYLAREGLESILGDIRNGSDFARAFPSALGAMRSEKKKVPPAKTSIAGRLGKSLMMLAVALVFSFGTSLSGQTSPISILDTASLSIPHFNPHMEGDSVLTYRVLGGGYLSQGKLRKSGTREFITKYAIGRDLPSDKSKEVRRLIDDYVPGMKPTVVKGSKKGTFNIYVDFKEDRQNYYDIFKYFSKYGVVPGHVMAQTFEKETHWEMVWADSRAGDDGGGIGQIITSTIREVVIKEWRNAPLLLEQIEANKSELERLAKKVKKDKAKWEKEYLSLQRETLRQARWYRVLQVLSYVLKDRRVRGEFDPHQPVDLTHVTHPFFAEDPPAKLTPDMKKAFETNKDRIPRIEMLAQTNPDFNMAFCFVVMNYYYLEVQKIDDPSIADYSILGHVAYNWGAGHIKEAMQDGSLEDVFADMPRIPRNYAYQYLRDIVFPSYEVYEGDAPFYAIHTDPVVNEKLIHFLIIQSQLDQAYARYSSLSRKSKLSPAEKSEKTLLLNWLVKADQYNYVELFKKDRKGRILPGPVLRPSPGNKDFAGLRYTDLQALRNSGGTSSNGFLRSILNDLERYNFLKDRFSRNKKPTTKKDPRVIKDRKPLTQKRVDDIATKRKAGTDEVKKTPEKSSGNMWGLLFVAAAFVVLVFNVLRASLKKPGRARGNTLKMSLLPFLFVALVSDHLLLGAVVLLSYYAIRLLWKRSGTQMPAATMDRSALESLSPSVSLKVESSRLEVDERVEAAVRLLIQGRRPQPFTHTLFFEESAVSRNVDPVLKREYYLQLTRLLGGFEGNVDSVKNYGDDGKWAGLYFLQGDELIRYIQDRSFQAGSSGLRGELARVITGRVHEAVRSGRPIADWKTFMAQTQALLDLLHSLGGTLCADRDGVDEDRAPLSDERRAKLQGRDLQWLLQAAFHSGNVSAENEELRHRAAGELEEAANRFGTRARLSSLGSTTQALGASLTEERHVLIQLSSRLMDGMSADLTASEKSQLDMLATLSRWISADGSLGGSGRLILQVDGSALSVQDVVRRLERRLGEGTLSGLKNNPRVAVAGSTDIDGYRLASGEVSARAVVAYLVEKGIVGKSQPLDIFALQGVPWDRTGVEDIVQLIIVLIGGIALHVTSDLDKALEAHRFIQIQA